MGLICGNICVTHGAKKADNETFSVGSVATVDLASNEEQEGQSSDCTLQNYIEVSLMLQYNHR